MNDIDLRTLIPFVRVVKLGSFSAAAEHLGITTPAVSRTIAKLERNLGVRLLNRTTRQLHLTSEGRDFFEKISLMIEGIEEATDRAQAATREPQGTVRIAVGATFGRYCLMPVLADFFLQYPGVELELDFDDNPRDLVERAFDVGIRFGQGKHATYVSRRLPAEFPVILVASPQYLSRFGIPNSVEDLGRLGCIGATTPWAVGNWKLERVKSRGAHGKRTMTEDVFPVPNGPLTFVDTHYDTALIAALHHIGIAPIALHAALPHLESGDLKVVLPDYRIKSATQTDNHIFVQYPHREYLPPKVRVFVEYVMQVFRARREIENSIEEYRA